MSSLRRLARDHASLQRALPPNYLCPHATDPIRNALPDELTSLAIYLAGPTSTPYTSGLFLLHLRIPPTYPAHPPTATFRTKIFHPNVDEKTGAVCLETLKRDWDPKLTLKDILVHISCLLVQPNPDSALNENAGVLVREDYSAFERKARLLTKIHANTPAGYRQDAEQARRRGEDDDSPRVGSGEVGVKIRTKENGRVFDTKSRPGDPKITSHMAAKENINNADGTTVAPDTVPSSILGKRVVSIGSDTASDLPHLGTADLKRHTETGEPLRKSPKHKHETESSTTTLAETTSHPDREDKENEPDEGCFSGSKDSVLGGLPSADLARPAVLRKISNTGPGRLRSHARIGIRRL